MSEQAERVVPAPFGLSDQAPVLEPLDGASVLVSVVVNLEHWTLDRPMPRAVLPAPHGLTVVPDVANHSWMLYGLRAGLPRLAAALAPLGDAVSVALNADVIRHYPQVGDLIEARGWHVLGHGVRQQSIQSVPDERAVITEAIAMIARRFGAPPRGWLSPGMNQTDDSLTLLRESGIEYCHDWMIDDRPIWLRSAAGPLIGLPYTLELNDVTTYQVTTQADGTLAGRVTRTLRRHLAETSNPLVMPIGLHPHIVGVAHRIGEVEEIVAQVVAAPGVKPVTSAAVADWYASQVPAPGDTAP